MVFSLLVPFASAISAWLSSWYSTKRALKTERHKMKFNATMKVADFRQNWINSLRDELAQFQSYGVYPHHDPTKDREFFRLGTKIELLMNPSDPDYQELQQRMYGFLNSASSDSATKYSQNTEFVVLCQRILKREWERLKKDMHAMTENE